jgi:hypothetical protein
MDRGPCALFCCRLKLAYVHFLYLSHSLSFLLVTDRDRLLHADGGGGGGPNNI